MTDTTPFIFPSLADQLGAVRLVLCGCGRRVLSDMMRDLRALPAGLRPRGEDFACDGCTEVLIREELVPEEQLYQLPGAPLALLARARARDTARQLARQARIVAGERLPAGPAIPWTWSASRRSRSFTEEIAPVSPVVTP